MAGAPKFLISQLKSRIPDKPKLQPVIFLIAMGKLKSEIGRLGSREGSMLMEQTIHTRSDDKTVVVFTPTGRLDITTAWQFRLKLQECIAKISPHLVINLGQVNFIDSSGLTSLVAGMRDADKAKGSFRICNVHPEAKLVFEVTMMDSVFEIYETEQEALAELPPSFVT